MDNIALVPWLTVVLDLSAIGEVVVQVSKQLIRCSIYTGINGVFVDPDACVTIKVVYADFLISRVVIV